MNIPRKIEIIINLKMPTLFLNFIRFIHFVLCVYVWCLCARALSSADALEGQKGIPEPPELELRTAANHR